MRRFRQLPLFAACLTVLMSSVPVSAQITIKDWSSVQTPPAPELKSVTIDPKTTALLVLDLLKQTCNEANRPRCLLTLPANKQLLTEARAHNVFVIYSIGGGGAIGDALPEVAPLGKEPVVSSGPNKFLNTDLEKILKDNGIKTVIVAGTSANGSVLHTASEAAFRGFKVVVPVDTMSGVNPFVDQYVAYHFTSAPRVSTESTLTTVGMIKY